MFPSDLGISTVRHVGIQDLAVFLWCYQGLERASDPRRLSAGAGQASSAPRMAAALVAATTEANGARSLSRGGRETRGDAAAREIGRAHV